MEPIVSGTTTERIVRTTLLAVLFSVGSGLFFRDGLVAYPRENMEEVILKKLGVPVPDPPPAISKTIDAASEMLAGKGDLVRDALAKFDVDPFVGKADTGETIHILFGPGGHLLIQSRLQVVLSADWVSGKHSGSALMVQLIIGAITGVVALIGLIHLVRVVTTSISLTEEGLKIRGKPLIPWDAMMGIDAKRYKKTGWLRLEYELGGRAGRLRLDNYWHKAFRPIVRAICARKGFDYELPPPRRGGTGDEGGEGGADSTS